MLNLDPMIIVALDGDNVGFIRECVCMGQSQVLPLHTPTPRARVVVVNQR